MPPGSPNQRPMNPTAAYQAAVAAASAVRPLQGSPSGSTQGMRPTAPQQPGATSIRPPMPPVPNAAINQQQRQTLLNRSHQIGNYIATMQARPGGSPLLRPPAVDVSPSVVTMARTPTPPPPTALPTGNSPNRTPQKKRNSTNKQG